jgi:hypothetical protein
VIIGQIFDQDIEKLACIIYTQLLIGL